MIERILKFDFAENKEPTYKEKIHQFLNPKKKMNGEDKPEISQHYYDTFNAIDRFAQYLGYIIYNHVIKKREMVVLINCLMMITENAWTIYQELHSLNLVEHTEESWKQFVLSLAKELQQ